jgi:hypothetical protein
MYKSTTVKTATNNNKKNRNNDNNNNNNKIFFCPNDWSGGEHKGVKLTGGFVFLRATHTAVRLWHDVLQSVRHHVNL